MCEIWKCYREQGKCYTSFSKTETVFSYSIEKFLQAEESAEKLIQTLEKLQTEAKSYQGATNELGIARDKLLELIESTKDVVSNSYEVIKTLKDIGGPEIFKRFTNLESKLDI